MTEVERREDEPGVFGNLPRFRPAHRSPRRAGSTQAGAIREATSERPPLQPRPKPRPSTTDATRPDPLEREREAAPATAEEERIGGLEDLAWAGIAVAAEAATLGVRLAGRAFEAARDAVERR